VIRQGGGGLSFQANHVAMDHEARWVVAGVRADAPQPGVLRMADGPGAGVIRFARTAEYTQLAEDRYTVAFSGTTSLSWPDRSVALAGEHLKVYLASAPGAPPAPAVGGAPSAGDMVRRLRLVEAVAASALLPPGGEPGPPPPPVTLRVGDARGGSRGMEADCARVVFDDRQNARAFLGEAALPDVAKISRTHRVLNRRPVLLQAPLDGLAVAAAGLEARQDPSTLAATGPGRVELASTAPGGEGQPPTPPAVLRFERRMTYDERAGDAVLEGGVRLVLPDQTLILSCDRMDLGLDSSIRWSAPRQALPQVRTLTALSDPSPGSAGQATLQWHPPPHPAWPDLPPEGRPGRTFWARAGRIVYDFTRQGFTLTDPTARGQRPEAIVQVIPSRGNPPELGAPVRQRAVLPSPYNARVLPDGGLETDPLPIGDQANLPPGAPMAFSD